MIRFSIPRLHLNRDLTMMRLYYLVWLGGSGLFSPFFNLYLIQQGLSGTEIGLLGPLGSLVAIIASPTWGRLNDRTGKTRRLLQLGLFGVACAIFGLRWQTAFWGFAIFSMFQALFGAGIDPLSTSLALSTIKKHQQSGFGSIRRWGSFGWAVLVPLGGWLVENTGLEVIFYTYALSLIVSAILLNWVQIDQKQASLTPNPASGNLIRQVQAVLRNPALLALLVSMLVSGILGRGAGQFQNVFLSQLGTSKQLIAIAAMIGSVIELPAMIWADRLLNRWGYKKILIGANLLDAVRMAIIFLLPGTFTILAMNALGGISLSLRIIATIAYITGNSSTEGSGLMLALFNVTLPNLIGMAASPLGGISFDIFGPRWLYAFALAGFFAAAGSIALLNPKEGKAADGH